MSFPILIWFLPSFQLWIKNGLTSLSKNTLELDRDIRKKMTKYLGQLRPSYERSYSSAASVSFVESSSKIIYTIGIILNSAKLPFSNLFWVSWSMTAQTRRGAGCKKGWITPFLINNVSAFPPLSSPRIRESGFSLRREWILFCYRFRVLVGQRVIPHYGCSVICVYCIE